MSQKLRMAKPFVGWKRPPAFFRFLMALFWPEKIVAQELPSTTRAQKPALTDQMIGHLHEVLLDWAHEETVARTDYSEHVERDPNNGDLYFQAYRRHCDAGEAMFRRRLEELANSPTMPELVTVPQSEIIAAMELAQNYKNWLVRRNFPNQYGESRVAFERSRWFFTNYLLQWERPRSQ